MSIYRSLRIKDFLKAIIDVDELTRRGQQAIQAFENDPDYSMTPDYIAVQAVEHFSAIFQRVFVRKSRHGEHLCDALFEPECYDTEHHFYYGWEPMPDEPCPRGCTAAKVWERVERWLRKAESAELMSAESVVSS